MELTSTISLIELFWVLIIGFGLIFSVSNAIEASRDVIALETAKLERTTRWHLAKGAEVADIVRAIVMALFLSVGIDSMFLKQPPPHPFSIHEYLGLIAFMVGAALLSLSSYLTRRTRRKVMKALRD